MTQHPSSSSETQPTDWSRHTLGDEYEVEQSDRRAGHDYLPMDVWVDPGDQGKHFDATSVAQRLTRRRRRHSPGRH